MKRWRNKAVKANYQFAVKWSDEFIGSAVSTKWRLPATRLATVDLTIFHIARRYAVSGSIFTNLALPGTADVTVVECHVTNAC